MKRIAALLLVFVLAAGLLSACGGEKHEPVVVVETPAPTAETEKPAPTEEAQPAPAPVPEETPQPEETEDDNEQYQIALGLVGKSVEELYAAIGYPETSDYGPSCIGDPGDKDGQLDYKGFSVFTLLKANGGETIVDVLRDDEF